MNKFQDLHQHFSTITIKKRGESFDSTQECFYSFSPHVTEINAQDRNFTVTFVWTDVDLIVRGQKTAADKLNNTCCISYCIFHVMVEVELFQWSFSTLKIRSLHHTNTRQQHLTRHSMTATRPEDNPESEEVAHTSKSHWEKYCIAPDKTRA